MSFPRYERYKESGVEWLGEVPEHWAVVRLKQVASVRLSNVDKLTAEGQSPVRLCNYVDVYKNRRITHAMNFMMATATEEQIARLALRNGDVIITKDSEDSADIGVPALVGGTIDRLVCGYHLALIRPGAVDGGFLYFLMCSDYVRAVFTAEATGITRYALGKYCIENLQLPTAPIPKQRAIAAFLDQETSKIDALIAEQHRLINLLKEKRQAVISHAVTRGLNPDAPMKDSVVEWLGEVPEYWHVVPSHTIFPESKERAHIEDEHLSATQKYGVIPLTEYERLEGRQVTHAVMNLDQRKHVEVGNFVVSMRSFEGGIERVKARGCVRSSYVALTAGGRAHVGFFSYLFKSSAYIQGLQATATFIRDGQDLNYNNFRQVKLPCPSVDEQQAIAAFLDRETDRIDLLVSEAERAITLLQERRSALISAAVTGKIDVRGLVESAEREAA